MKLAIIGSTGLVGSKLADLGRSHGHVVTGVSKDTDVDLLSGAGLDEVLSGVDTVVNVIQSPNFEQEASTKFFTTVAGNLGKSAAKAGVSRTVVLSIVGVDRVAAAAQDAGTGYDGYYKGKYAQELATLEHSPGAHVVRSTQFHDIARQAIDWGRADDKSTVPDLSIQPLAVAAMVEVLLEVADGSRDGDVIEVGGPRAEHLAALSTVYAGYKNEDVQIVAGPVGDAVRDGILLPGPDAVLVGPNFDEWLAAQPHG